jgi:hypothetical protein
MRDWRVTGAVAVALALIVCGPVGAQQAETVMTPLSFHGESGKIPIGACLQLKVRTYPDTPWWLSTSKAGAAEKAMGTVLTALKTKNRKALLEVSGTTVGEDGEGIRQSGRRADAAACPSQCHEYPASLRIRRLARLRCESASRCRWQHDRRAFFFRARE